MLTPAEWMALGFSGGLLLVSGVWHLFGLRLLRWLTARRGWTGSLSVLIAFWGLALLHFSEIVIGACVYAVAIHHYELGAVLGGYGDSAGGLLYLSGVNFATLGYTDQSVTGPLRLMTMMQSLAGFMLITWSATFVYSAWEQRARKEFGDD